MSDDDILDDEDQAEDVVRRGAAWPHAGFYERDVSWHADAPCAGIDPDLWFPEKGGTTEPAKEICAQCLVRADCLDYALDTGERFGIWGGASERERRRLQRTLRQEGAA